MGDLPSRPQPGYVPGCGVCERRRAFDRGIACVEHRTADERAWYAAVERIAAAPRVRHPEPTLF